MNDGQDLIERWRQMAEECRAKAEQMSDAGARSSFLHMARTYDSMADRFERRAPVDSLAASSKPEQVDAVRSERGGAGQRRNR